MYKLSMDQSKKKSCSFFKQITSTNCNYTQQTDGNTERGEVRLKPSPCVTSRHAGGTWAPRILYHRTTWRLHISNQLKTEFYDLRPSATYSSLNLFIFVICHFIHKHNMYFNNTLLRKQSCYITKLKYVKSTC